MSLDIFVQSAQLKAKEFFEKEEKLDYNKILDLENRPLSPSSLKNFLVHPAEFIHKRQEKWKGNAATIFGNLCDVIIYTPNELESRFVIAPLDMPSRPQERSINAKYMTNPKSKDDFAKKAKLESDLARWKEFDEKNGDKLGIVESDLVEAFIIQGRFQRSEWAMKLFNATEQVQRKLSWTDKETGLPMIGYTDQDGMLGNTPFIADLKVMDSADPNIFPRRAFDLGYDLAVGCYCNGYIEKFHKYPDFYHIVMEKEPPYAMNVFKVSSSLMTYAKSKAELTLKEFQYCMDNELWHTSWEFRSELVGYNSLDLPAWVKAKESM